MPNFDGSFPVIAAARTEEEFCRALESECSIVFWLSPSIMNLEKNLVRAKKLQGGKYIFVHLDMTDGVGKDSCGIEYLKSLGVDGIISTRGNLIKHAREAGLLTVQRFFMVDSRSLNTALETIHTSKPDMIEIMPGIIPNIITRIVTQTEIPLIAGGLIDSEKDVAAALRAGAGAISTSKCELWGKKY